MKCLVSQLGLQDQSLIDVTNSCINGNSFSVITVVLCSLVNANVWNQVTNVKTL